MACAKIQKVKKIILKIGPNLISSIKMRYFLILFVFIVGCATPRYAIIKHPTPEYNSDQACTDLLYRRDTARLWGKILSGVGGGGAFATIPSELSQTSTWLIASGAAGSVAIGMALWWFGDEQGENFEKYCQKGEER